MSSVVRKSAVAVGGGTGLPSVLRALLDLGFETSAVVTMADDGGSSGALRRELGILPPGDIRNCLVAMAGDPTGLRAQLFQYRFAQGEGLSGHAVGNLVLAALTDLSGSFPEAINVVGEFLDARGKVLPSTLADVELHGVDRMGREVFGQACLASNEYPVEHALLEPANPPAYGPAIEAIAAADAVVVGPGSLYTSIIPNFLVDGVAAALAASRAKRVYVCNVANMRGETNGLDAADHVEALIEHGLGGCIDVAIVHRCDSNEALCPAEVEPVVADDRVVARIEALGIQVVCADLADRESPVRHAPAVLTRVLGEVLG